MAIGAVAGNVHYHQARPRVVWPVRVGVPHAPAVHYQQRRAHADMVETLATGRSVVLVGAGRRAGVVVSGMGGVGKTQLAAHHAWSVWADAELAVAVWVSALSRNAIVTAYAEAAARVLVEQDHRIADRSPDEAAERFREWLAGTSRRLLIVVDDVQDPADLRGLDPPPGPSGQVVVTSRQRDAAAGRGGHRGDRLDVFTPDSGGLSWPRLERLDLAHLGDIVLGGRLSWPHLPGDARISPL
ncbi:NB-ARC domain-containing protein [Actinosynnema sp. NPDC049800]